MQIDYMNPGERKRILEEILGNEENLRRKEQSLMAFEIYKGRQAQFILKKMSDELGPAAAKNSRTITSINLTKKIVKEQASLYKVEPERNWSDLNDSQHEHAELVYEYAMADQRLKKANEIFKLIDQAAIQIVLKDGKICFRPMMPHHYDVVPKPSDPEKADAYIISSFDKWRLFGRTGNGNTGVSGKNYFSDSSNQTIGEADDYRGKVLFYWWTEQFNFITDKSGNMVDEMGRPIAGVNEDMVANPIQKLPFVDIAADKDFEFFVRSGNNISQMTIDLGVLISDVTEIARLQGFSQGVISSVEQPKDLIVGPRRLVWLKVSPNDTEATRPQFSFVSPTPDLTASLQLVANYLSLFLTSQGLSPKVVNVAGDSEKFASGVDRFLSMVEKFEASQDDMSLFRTVESEIWEIVKAWNNTYYQATENGLMQDLSGVFLPETSEVMVQFKQPAMLMNETEKVDLYQRKLDLGIMTRAEAIAADRDITVEEADKIVLMIDAEEGMMTNGQGVETNSDEQSSETGSES
jgi:hypothetical protein